MRRQLLVEGRLVKEGYEAEAEETGDREHACNGERCLHSGDVGKGATSPEQCASDEADQREDKFRPQEG